MSTRGVTCITVVTRRIQFCGQSGSGEEGLIDPVSCNSVQLRAPSQGFNGIIVMQIAVVGGVHTDPGFLNSQ